MRSRDKVIAKLTAMSESQSTVDSRCIPRTISFYSDATSTLASQEAGHLLVE